uniref:Uncharacterized protein n=1 Tax=Arundo donax TaxID=35708 RepID=A0A0A9GZM5_ARUDO
MFELRETAVLFFSQN